MAHLKKLREEKQSEAWSPPQKTSVLSTVPSTAFLLYLKTTDVSFTEHRTVRTWLSDLAELKSSELNPA